MTQNAVPHTDTTPPLHREPEAGSNTAVALQRAVAHPMGLQQDDGWWRGELETKVTMDAEDLLLREFLRIRGAADTEEAAHCIRSQQRRPAGGSWTSCPTRRRARGQLLGAAIERGPGAVARSCLCCLCRRVAGRA
jgi:hypothetical protein